MIDNHETHAEHLDNARFRAGLLGECWRAHRLGDAARYWPSDDEHGDTLVTDGVNVYQVTSDGETWRLWMSDRPTVVAHAASSARLVTYLCHLAPGEIGPDRMPEPLEVGARVACYLDDRPALAVRVPGRFELAWFVASSETAGWRRWSEITDPCPWTEE